MPSIKEISDKQLEKVHGGGDKWEEDHNKYLPAGSYGAHIGKDDAKNHTNSEFYVVDDVRPWYYCWGTLTSSNGTNHYVTVKGKSHAKPEMYFPTTTCEIGKTCAFLGSTHTLFLYK